ncbi:enoyl-CoA hydratase [Solimicrobium silvestre]|uniref:Enoyl-CoA hydratase/carnithine racemase n=1 Tax=Solimicrobium silvestre TaxID=2099400 RepID=A0A2S9H0S2_9BURK|nr:enoyl-CoA hydratase [Solimicrobium silvestre]PRC93579.1 Enoyl-CoA hydratase/carnithine racemase [Solimicrobium silvestre]
MDILTNKENSILTITFNRPEKKNAITGAMYQTMADALRAAETDNEVRVILLTGSDSIFTAGNDLEDFMKNAAQFVSGDAENTPVVQFMRALSSAQKPVIAAVAGLGVGIGTTLLMHCDLVYLADNAKLTMPFSQLGLCPEFSSSILLQKIAGYHRAAEKLMLGEAFSAQEALEMGMANKVVPAAELLAYANQQASKLVALPAASLRATKRLMKASQTSLVNEVMQGELQQFGKMLNGPEAKEAFMAFFQKRKPDFSQFS